MRLSWFRLGFLREQCGAAAAEFAMVVLPMTVFSFAIIQMGSLLFLWNDMNSAAREGVRALVVDERLDITDDGSVTYSCGGFGGYSVPPALSAAKVTCDLLAGWHVDFDVETVHVLAAPDVSMSCMEMTVTVSADMGSAALVDLFGVLSGRTMDVSATMVTEYVPQPVGYQTSCQ